MNARTPKSPAPNVAFLPDADELERTPLPRQARTTLYVLLACLLSFLLWASLSEVDRVVVASGRLITRSPNIVIQPLELSLLQSIDVRPGEVVKRGDQLATLDATFAGADQSQLRSRLESLQVQLDRLQAELDGTGSGEDGAGSTDSGLQAGLARERQASYRAQLEGLSSSRKQAEAALAANRHDQQMLTTRVALLREIETMQAQLQSKGLGSKLQLLEARDKRMEIERDLEVARSRERELELETTRLATEQSAFENGWRQRTYEELLSTTRERDALREQLLKADKRRDRVVLNAPVDAVVLSVARVAPNAVVREAEPLITLVPLGEELEAEVRIDASDVGYVKTGDRARLKFDAFPFQRHGHLDGEVRAVSEDAFQRDPGTAATSATYYAGYVTLGRPQFRNVDPDMRLLPGMTANCEIVVGQRSVMSYLIWPLTRALDESIREP